MANRRLNFEGLDYMLSFVAKDYRFQLSPDHGTAYFTRIAVSLLLSPLDIILNVETTKIIFRFSPIALFSLSVMPWETSRFTLGILSSLTTFLCRLRLDWLCLNWLNQLVSLLCSVLLVFFRYSSLESS